MKQIWNNHRHDILIALVLVIIGTVPRILELEQVVPGLHGDEAWTGLDARRILATGPIAPYVGSAMGQPTGPLYVTALLFALFGESVTTLRLSMALFGIATVPLLYILLRLYFPRLHATLLTLSFAFLLMHLHFSRLGFMLISAPFFQVATFVGLGLAARQRNLWWVGVSGLFCGLGLYSYNAFLVFPPLVFAYLLAQALFARTHTAFRRTQIVVFAGVFLLVTAPLIYIMLTDPEFYFARHRGYSVMQMPELQAATGPRAQFAVLSGHIAQNLRVFFQAGKIDGVDGFGTFFNFLPLQMTLIIAGLLAVLVRRNRHHMLLCCLGMALLLAATLTFDAIYRRQILSLIPLFLLMGYGLHFWLGRVPIQARAGIMLVLALGIAVESGYALHTYWTRVAHEPGVRQVFAADLVQTLQAHAAYPHQTGASNPQSNLQSNPRLVLFTDRFYCRHESIRFLLADQECTGGRETDHAAIFETRPDSPMTLVFLSPYHEYIDRATAWHGTGERQDIVENGRLVGILYRVNAP